MSIQSYVTVLFLVTVAVLLPSAKSDLKCQPGWKLYHEGQTCVRLFTKNKNYDDARKDCQSQGADLIRIDSAAKAKFFKSMYRGNDAWIGLKRESRYSKNFIWLDDTSPTKYNDWNKHEPNNYGGYEGCTQIVRGSKWNDQRCTVRYYYYCEMPATRKAPYVCPSGWRRHGDECYLYSTTPRTWANARKHCMELDSMLASVPNADVQNFLSKKLLRGARDSVWIGLNDLKRIKDYRWDDNAPLGAYKHWARGMPDNAGRGAECVTLWKSSKFQWDDTSCFNRHRSVCQKSIRDLRCLNSWSLYAKKKVCLKTFRTLKSWSDARADCKRYGADLVKITDADMNGFIDDWLVSYPNLYWNGLHKGSSSNQLTWLDSTSSAAYGKTMAENWPMTQETCGTIQHGQRSFPGKPCSSKLYYMCQKNAYASIACPDGYTPYVAGGTCLKVSSQTLEWENAREDCQDNGGDLVTIENSVTSSFVKALVKGSRYPYWIGLHDRHKNNQFQWLDSTKKLRFTNWQPNQPNDRDGSQNCVIIVKQAKWLDFPCISRQRYICQVKATVYGIDPHLKKPKKMCAEGWTKNGDKCLKYNDKPKTWKDARATCKAQGGDLVTIKTEDKATFINSLLTGKKATVEPYIGLNALKDPNAYVWLDEKVPAEFTPWYGDEPSRQNEHCVIILVTNSYNFDWSDVDCQNKKGFICEMDSQLPGSANCGAGWEDIPDSNTCYRFNTEPLNWLEAENSCKVKGGHLISLFSMEEMLYLEGRMKSLDNKTFWIGGNDRDSRHGWRWSDGSPFAFFNWDHGQPSGNYSKNCITMERDTGRWSIDSCQDNVPSICEKQTNDITPSGSTVAPFTPPVGKTYACPKGWASYASSTMCYSHYAYSKGQTWAQVSKWCNQQGAELASIWDRKENNFLLSVLSSKFGDAWIGLRDFHNAYTFEWSDGTAIGYTNWDAHQPMVSSDTSVENCGYISERTGRWSVTDCNSRHRHFVCMKEKELIDKAEVEAMKGCAKGGVGYNDKCYVFVKNMATFQNAQASCQKIYRGNLAAVKDRYIQSFLSTYLAKSTYWIGLSNTKPESVPGSPQPQYPYSWLTGGKVSFVNWDRVHSGAEIKTCVGMVSKKPVGLWHSYQCNKKQKFICEYKRPGHTTPKPPTTTTVSVLEPCPDGFIGIGNMCYKFVTDRKLSWISAKYFCKGAVTSHGTLASITNMGLLDKITKEFIKGIKSYLWIGLNDRGREGGYRWDGGEPFLYANWLPGQPDNKHNTQDCVHLHTKLVNSRRAFDDLACSSKQNFICQAPRGVQLHTTPFTPTLGPPSKRCGREKGWYEHKGYCYWTSKGANYRLSGKFIYKKSWFDAKDVCNRLGGELASILNSDENEFLTFMINQLKMSDPWIGLNDFDGDVYKWSDGSPAYFFTWAKGEPNDGAGGERCVTMRMQGVWNDFNCQKSMDFICKKKLGSSVVVTNPPTALPKGGCPANFVGTAGTHHCYHVGGIDKSDRLTFVDAAAACRKVSPKSRLASLHSTIDDEFVMTLIANLHVPAWIGLKTDAYYYSSSNFLWTDNTKTDYVNWAPKYPQRGGYGKTYSCVEMMIKSNIAGEWENVNCRDKMAYVCEYRKDELFNTNPPNTEGCVQGYTRFGDSCYKFQATPQDWATSDSNCVKDGGHLVNIHGGFESANADLQLQSNNLNEMWIGLSIRKNEKTFTWTNNFPVLYTAWDRDEPSPDGRCVSQLTDKRWRAKDCQTKLPSLCRIYLSGSPPAVTPSVPGKCPSKIWTKYGNKCYFVESKLKRSWPEASYECTSLGGTLASVHNDDDQFAISMFLRNDQVDAWIGLHAAGSAGYSWTDNTPASYFSWAMGSPNEDTNGTRHQACVFAQGFDGNWTDTNCFKKMNFFCQVNQIPLYTTTLPTTTTTTPSTTTTSTTTPSTTTTSTTRATRRSTTTASTTRSSTTTPRSTTLAPNHFTHRHSKQSGSSASSAGLAGGQTAGIVIAILIILALVVVGTFLFRRRRAQHTADPNEPTSGFDNAIYDATNEDMTFHSSGNSTNA